eukprot:TRINITY_DN3622_c0_g2_i1.p1 TRINITY_DN3622_c0_g2~~TRINITY_DN3622_c0_g2_i1.p1  ORF type:complete len:414 (-),score=84.77 TRINITY_DN3622_c0_g2_i1:155-1366(-)
MTNTSTEEVSSFAKFALDNFHSLFGAGETAAAAPVQEGHATGGSDDAHPPAEEKQEALGVPVVTTPSGVNGLTLPPKLPSWSEEPSQAVIAVQIPIPTNVEKSPESKESNSSLTSSRPSPLGLDGSSNNAAAEELVLHGAASRPSSPCAPGWVPPGAPLAAAAADLTSAGNSLAAEPEEGGLTAFSVQLATATQMAPQRLAERLAEQLQQFCMEEAGLGQNTFTWDAPLPSGSRSFMQQVARKFVSKAEALGFESVEWWNGREWRQSLGKYHVLHDTVYDKYYMRIRVRWLDRLPPEESESPVRRFSHQRTSSAGPYSALAPFQSHEQSVIEQVQQWLELQRQCLEEQLQERQTNPKVETSLTCQQHPPEDMPTPSKAVGSFVNSMHADEELGKGRQGFHLDL